MRARDTRSRAVRGVAAALIALAPAAARADDKRDAYSPYEQQTIDRALARVHALPFHSQVSPSITVE